MDKSELQNWLHESYEEWEAFLDQVGTARMDEPGVAGHWSMKDIIVHLTAWDRYVVARLQAARRGEPEPPPPWPADLQNDDEINAWLYERTLGSFFSRSSLSWQIYLPIPVSRRSARLMGESSTFCG